MAFTLAALQPSCITGTAYYVNKTLSSSAQATLYIPKEATK